MTKHRKGEKPWKKGRFSKKLIPPYQPSPDDFVFMEKMLICRDDAFLAFNKPSGLPCQTRNPDDRTFDKLLAVFARSNGKRPRMVHRLDAQTSGVIIAANTKPAAAFLSTAFADRFAQKTYVAIVEGEGFRESAGEIDAPLQRYQHAPNLALMRVAAADAQGALSARTGYRVLASEGRFHFLELKPETGRMHQIRAHLAYKGAPILGDPYYGGAQTAQGVRVGRLMLHARALVMPHPDAGEIDVTAPLAEDMRGLLSHLKLDMSALAY